MCIEAKVSKKLVSSDNTRRTKMRESGNGTSQKFVVSIVLAFLIATLVVPADSFPYGDSGAPPTVLLERFCSKSLSDALYLICKDRGGYNEPFSYSREETQRSYSGPGLVEECCHSPCSLQQLEQYCKPLKTEEDSDYSQEGIKESLGIIDQSYDSPEEVETEESSHAVTRDEHDVERKNKSKLRSVAGVRRAGRNKGKGRKHAGPFSKTANLTQKIYKAKRLRDHKDVRYANRNNNDADSPINRGVRTRSKNILRHHKRAKRPLRFKFQPPRDTAIAKVPGFKVGTTLPDAQDSTIHIFPSRRNLVIERTAKDLAASANTEKIE